MGKNKRERKLADNEAKAVTSAAAHEPAEAQPLGSADTRQKGR